MTSFVETHTRDMALIRKRFAEAVPTAPRPPVPPLVDQLRDYLLTLPPAQKERISLPAILPHLRGKYRTHPHLLSIARAMRQLGYHPVRSWKKNDHAHRYWIAPRTTQSNP
jgi:hypothetical protein